MSWLNPKHIKVHIRTMYVCLASARDSFVIIQTFMPSDRQKYLIKHHLVNYAPNRVCSAIWKRGQPTQRTAHTHTQTHSSCSAILPKQSTANSWSFVVLQQKFEFMQKFGHSLVGFFGNKSMAKQREPSFGRLIRASIMRRIWKRMSHVRFSFIISYGIRTKM